MEVIEYFVDEDFCELVAEDIHALQSEWTTYDEVQTLGGSMYLHPWSMYSKLRNKRARFTTTRMVKVLQYLEAHFRAKTPMDFCPPGYHIFDSSYSEVAGQIHIDSHARKHPLFWESRATHTALTITLPIELPSAFAGLHFHRLDEGVISTQEYKVGNLYIHDGQTPHSIYPSKIEPGEHRITLQGFVWRKIHEDIQSPVPNLIFF